MGAGLGRGGGEVPARRKGEEMTGGGGGAPRRGARDGLEVAAVGGGGPVLGALVQHIEALLVQVSEAPQQAANWQRLIGLLRALQVTAPGSVL